MEGNCCDKEGNGWSLMGMNALVTGGTKGIGHAIVEELARQGASVYTCSRSQVDIDQCIQRWESMKFSVAGSACDVSSEEERVRLMEAVSAHFHGKLHILVNNAGIYICKPAVGYTMEEYSRMMSTNFESSFHLSLQAQPLLKASGMGSIVFISSMAGLVGIGGTAAYAATKGAINQFTRNLACEWGKDNIRANCVAPGPINVGFSIDENTSKQIEAKTFPSIPLRRYGKPREVAALVAFLCMPVATYISGQVIAIDGGITSASFFPDVTTLI